MATNVPCAASSDIGPQHHRERWNEADETASCKTGHHQRGRRAALQNGGDAHAGEKRFQPIIESRCEKSPQPGAKCALDAGLDHANAPQHQRNRARQSDHRVNEIHIVAAPFTGWISRCLALNEMTDIDDIDVEPLALMPRGQ